MKNIAICFFGMPRSIKDNCGVIEKMSNFDIFSHFWSDNKDLDTVLREKFLHAKTLYIESPTNCVFHGFSDIICTDSNSLKLKNSYEKNGFSEFENPLETPGWRVNPKNITSMWNSMSKSVSLALSYASNNNFVYDRIILLRTDVVFSESFDITNTFVGDIHKFLMPSYHPGSRIPLWVPDHVISMSSEAARIMTFLPQFSYHYYMTQRVPLIPEIMLGHHMSTQGMNITSNDLYYRREYKFYGDDGKI